MIEKLEKDKNLPVGLEINLEIPGITNTLKFTTTEEGHDLEDTILHILNIQSVDQKILGMTFSELTDAIYKAVGSVNLTDKEIGQYDFAKRKDGNIYYARFIAMVLSRYNTEDKH